VFIFTEAGEKDAPLSAVILMVEKRMLEIWARSAFSVETLMVVMFVSRTLRVLTLSVLILASGEFNR
jgi:hypothetical protein